MKYEEAVTNDELRKKSRAGNFAFKIQDSKKKSFSTQLSTHGKGKKRSALGAQPAVPWAETENNFSFKE